MFETKDSKIFIYDTKSSEQIGSIRNIYRSRIWIKYGGDPYDNYTGWFIGGSHFVRGNGRDRNP